MAISILRRAFIAASTFATVAAAVMWYRAAQEVSEIATQIELDFIPVDGPALSARDLASAIEARDLWRLVALLTIPTAAVLWLTVRWIITGTLFSQKKFVMPKSAPRTAWGWWLAFLCFLPFTNILRGHTKYAGGKFITEYSLYSGLMGFVSASIVALLLFALTYAARWAYLRVKKTG